MVLKNTRRCHYILFADRATKLGTHRMEKQDGQSPAQIHAARPLAVEARKRSGDMAQPAVFGTHRMEKQDGQSPAQIHAARTSPSKRTSAPVTWPSWQCKTHTVCGLSNKIIITIKKKDSLHSTNRTDQKEKLSLLRKREKKIFLPIRLFFRFTLCLSCLVRLSCLSVLYFRVSRLSCPFVYLSV